MGGLRDREHIGMTGQKIQRHLTRSSAMALSDLRQQTATDTVNARELPVPERRISYDRNLFLRTLREQPYLDSSVFEMIEHLVARQALVFQRVSRALQSLHIEVADSRKADQAPFDQLLHGSHRFFDRMAARPVQHVKVEPIRPKASQAAFASFQGALIRGVRRKDFTCQKHLVAAG